MAITNYKNADQEKINNWMHEFKVSSRYQKPREFVSSHHFDMQVYTQKNNNTVTFYNKFVQFVKKYF